MSIEYIKQACEVNKRLCYTGLTQQEVSTFRFAHITDLHLADRDFGNHRQGVQEELWKQLDEVAQTCIDEDRSVLFITGDFFEFKRPNLVSHRLVERLINYFFNLQAQGVQVLAIAGNHDLGPDGMASLNRQPLGVIASSGAIDLLEEPTYIDGDCLVTPLNFRDELETNPEAYRCERPDRARTHIVLAHGSLAPDDAQYNFYVIPHSKVPAKGIDLLLYGHIHEYHGICALGSTVFANPGSFCRRSRTQQRDVYMIVGEVADGGLFTKTRKLKSASPWQDIFVDLPGAIEIDVDPEISALARDARSLVAIDAMDYRTFLSGLHDRYPKGVLDLATSYIEQAEHALYS